MAPAIAAVRLPALFSDHMVVQRGAEVPVWGWADPGEKISVGIAGQTRTATADANGKWNVRFDKLDSAGPTTLTVAGGDVLTVNDVLVGEVWLASGQSNMQMPVSGVRNNRAEIASAKHPEIRMFTVARKTAVAPQDDCGGKWIVCGPETAGQFSATAYFFGLELQRSLKRPVGLINASWGGTAIEGWTSMPAQEKQPELAGLIGDWRKKAEAPYEEARAMALYGKQVENWKNQSEKAKAAGKKPPQAPKKPVAPRLQPNHPANLFNGMIAPLIPYAIRGAIWYQGENNAKGGRARLYGIQLPVMVRDWRQRWGQGDFPFAWVQLPNFKDRPTGPGTPSGWAAVREAMLRSLSLPNTGMAVTIDVGEADNIHPKDKQTVGKRLALWARARVYGEAVAFSGPRFSRHEIRGSEVAIVFAHADGGLAAKDGELRGFAIAGADRKWVAAKTRIEGDKVVVFHPAVPSPAAVRYAWEDNPDCNLTNKSGLPASPFRTDDW